MRVVQFIQVVVLLLLGAYVVLVQLQNPTRVVLPLPFGLEDLTLPLGTLIALTLLVGAAYASLLYVPRLLIATLRRRRAVQASHDLETRLNATLRAKLAQSQAPATLSVSETVPDEPADPDSGALQPTPSSSAPSEPRP